MGLRPRALVHALPFLFLSGCIYHAAYPDSWPRLSDVPSDDCRQHEGTYADRGEMPDSSLQPSLTRELFGPHTEWLIATRVSFTRPHRELLGITVWSGNQRLFTRTVEAQAGDFVCEAGRLIIHDRRWFAVNVLAGREAVTAELYRSEEFLVVQVRTFNAGVFIIVPMAGIMTAWYRFKRLDE